MSASRPYLKYQFGKSLPDRWGGLDIEITVDKNWDAQLFSVPKEDRPALLEKILSAISPPSETNELYLSRVTMDKQGNVKAWFIENELSLENSDQPYTFQALILNPEALRNAKKHPRLRSKGTSEYPSAILLDDDDDEDEVKHSKDTRVVMAQPLRPMKDAFDDSSAFTLSKRVEIEDDDISLLVFYLNNQISTLIAEEKERSGPGTTYAIPSVIDSLRATRQELSNRALALSLYLNPDMTPPKDDSEYKADIQVAEQYFRELKQQRPYPEAADKELVQRFREDIRTLADRIDKHLPRIIEAARKRRELERQLEEHEQNKEGFTRYKHQYVIKRTLKGESDTLLQADSASEEKVKKQPKSEAKREEPARTSWESKREANITVAANWDHALPASMNPQQRLIFLSQVFQHLCSDELRNSLDPAQTRLYTDLHLARVQLVGDKVKGWFSNTSMPYQWEYDSLTFEINAKDLAQLKPGELRAEEVVSPKKKAQASGPRENKEKEPFWVDLDRRREMDVRIDLNAEADEIVARFLPVSIQVNPQCGANLDAVTRERLLTGLCAKLAEENEKLPWDDAGRTTQIYVSQITFDGNRHQIWYADASKMGKEKPTIQTVSATPKELEKEPSPLAKEKFSFEPATGKDKEERPAQVEFNAEVQAEIKLETELRGPLKVVVNPHWGDGLTHLGGQFKEDLLQQLLYLLTMQNETLTRQTGRLPSIYVSQVTLHGSEYKVWYADTKTLDQEHAPVKAFPAAAALASQVPPLTPQRERGKFNLLPPSEEKHDPQRYDRLNARVKALVEVDVETVAAQKFKVDIFDEASRPIIDRRNQLRALGHQYSKASEQLKALEAEYIDPSESKGLVDDLEIDIEDAAGPDASVIQEALKEFKADATAQALRERMAKQRTVITAHLENERKQLDQKEEGFRALVSRQFATIRRDVEEDKTLFRDELATPLAVVVQLFIPEFLKSVKEMKPGLRDLFDSSVTAPKIQAKALEEFTLLYSGMIPLDIKPQDLSKMEEKEMIKLASELGRKMTSTASRHELLDRINIILSQEKFISFGLAEKFADLLKKQLQTTVRDGLFKLTSTSPIGGVSQLECDFDKMEERLTQSRSKELQAERKKHIESVRLAGGQEDEIEAKITQYATQVDTLRQIRDNKIKEQQAKQAAQHEAQQAKLLQVTREANQSTAPELKALEEALQSRTLYLRKHFGIEEKADEAKRDKQIAEKRVAKVSKPEKFKKLDASGALLVKLEAIQKRVSELKAMDYSRLPLAEQVKLLREKETLVNQIKTAFNTAQASISGKGSLVSERGWFAKKMNKTSPKILLNEFFDPGNKTNTGLQYFVAQGVDLHTKVGLALSKIPEAQKAKPKAAVESAPPLVVRAEHKNASQSAAARVASPTELASPSRSKISGSPISRDSSPSSQRSASSAAQTGAGNPLPKADDSQPPAVSGTAKKL